MLGAPGQVPCDHGRKGLTLWRDWFPSGPGVSSSPCDPGLATHRPAGDGLGCGLWARSDLHLTLVAVCFAVSEVDTRAWHGVWIPRGLSGHGDQSSRLTRCERVGTPSRGLVRGRPRAVGVKAPGPGGGRVHHASARGVSAERAQSRPQLGKTVRAHTKVPKLKVSSLQHCGWP